MMKLTYRGHSYEVSAPTQPSSMTSQADLKLTYRGHTYEHRYPTTVMSKAVSKAMVKAGSEATETYRTTLTLLYRGQTYKHQLQTTTRLSNQFRLPNWRYQPLEEV